MNLSSNYFIHETSTRISAKTNIVVYTETSRQISL
jgi:hypothetical protein